MANFVLLYSGGSMPETEAEQAAVMQAWGAWFGQLGRCPGRRGQSVYPAGQTHREQRKGQ